MDENNLKESKKVALTSSLSLLLCALITVGASSLKSYKDDKIGNKEATTKEVIDKLDDYLMNCEIEDLSSYLNIIGVINKNGEYKEVNSSGIYKDNMSLKEYIKENNIKADGYSFSTLSSEEKLSVVEDYYGEEVSDLVKENGFPIKVYSYKNLK